MLTVVGLQTQSPAHARLGMQSHGERPQNWERCFARPVDLRGHGFSMLQLQSKRKSAASSSELLAGGEAWAENPEGYEKAGAQGPEHFISVHPYTPDTYAIMYRKVST